MALAPRSRGHRLGSLQREAVRKCGSAARNHALAKGEIDAGAVTPAAIGWFNKTHPDGRVRRIPAFEDEPDLNWNVAVGMVRPDDKLRQDVDAALQALLADGTLARIYARYDVELRPPQ